MGCNVYLLHELNVSYFGIDYLLQEIVKGNLKKWPKLATETDFLGIRICHFYDQEHDKTQGQLSARVVYQLL